MVWSSTVCKQSHGQSSLTVTSIEYEWPNCAHGGTLNRAVQFHIKRELLQAFVMLTPSDFILFFLTGYLCLEYSCSMAFNDWSLAAEVIYHALKKKSATECSQQIKWTSEDLQLTRQFQGYAVLCEGKLSGTLKASVICFGACSTCGFLNY